MEPSDITIEILRSIRDEVRGMRGEMSGIRGEMSGIRGEVRGNRKELVRLGTRVDEMGRHIVASELRTATAISDLAGTVNELTVVLREQADLRPRVEKNEHDIAALKQRVPRDA